MSVQEHLSSGTTHLCRAWDVTRRDGVQMGFTDHDRDLEFDGILYRADSGLSAMAVQQTTGLSVDNTDALGALSADAISEADIAAGRFDDAEVRAWLVRWDDVTQRALQFRGRIGNLTRQGPAFTAELRGLTEALNVPGGRIFHRACPAVLGDSGCGVDLDDARYHTTVKVTEVAADGRLTLEAAPGYAPNWFERGRLEVLSGAAKGLSAVVQADVTEGDARHVTLWAPMAAPIAAGDEVHLVAGCDKRFETCKSKFSNGTRFQGFPHIPGEDWQIAIPRSSGVNDGGSLIA